MQKLNYLAIASALAATSKNEGSFPKKDPPTPQPIQDELIARAKAKRERKNRKRMGNGANGGRGQYD